MLLLKEYYSLLSINPLFIQRKIFHFF